MLLHGDPSLLSAFAVCLLDESLVIAPPTPPRGAEEPAAGTPGGGQQSARAEGAAAGKGEGKGKGRIAAEFPEALLGALVRHLLAHPHLKVNVAAEAFTAQHLQEGAVNTAVKREIKRTAEYCNKRWEIRPEALHAAGVADADALRPAPAVVKAMIKAKTPAKPVHAAAA
eukprot:319079-Pyramimonas_sp.AAC.1